MSRNSPQRGKRFAWRFIHNYPRSLRTRLNSAVQSIFVHPAPVKRLIR